MKTRIINKSIAFVFLVFSSMFGCIPKIQKARIENKYMPSSFYDSRDTTNVCNIKWSNYFADSNLIALIDTALKNNQELNIVLQEIEISKNEVRAKKGEYLPFVGVNGKGGLENVPRFTWPGAIENNVEIKNGPDITKSLTDYVLGAQASWEIDVWKKLRNAKKSAVMRFLASVEGKNFMVTNLIAEIANTYYELIALDNQLEIVKKNIEIQSNALHAVRQEKDAAKQTQLAVNRFEALLLNTQNLQFDIQQRIVETENHINYLIGRFPRPIQRSSFSFANLIFDTISAGVPSQILYNRPDIRKAELDLAAAKLDVRTARANFYPSLKIDAGIGYKAFNPGYLINPESMLFSAAGELVAPLINRNAIAATYNNANAKQLQAVYKYEQTILNGFIEVLNLLSKNELYEKSYTTKLKEVNILTQSINIANNLFKSARADYMEVLLTQREALETKMELIEIRLKQANAKVNVYKALGGGWK